jgi:uncharacterized delta-60 repeat protein
MVACRTSAQNDGAVDTSFVIGSGATGSVAELVRVVEVDERSRILVAGSFTNFGGISSAGIARLLPSGANDPAFQPGVGFARAGSLAFVFAILRLSQGNILLGGQFDSFNDVPVTNLVMLTESGTIDTNFSPQISPNERIFALAQQPSGAIVVAGASWNSRSAVLKRLTPTGAADASFQSPAVTGSVFAVTVQSDGGILIGGLIQSVAGMPANGLVRLTVNGGLDASFKPALANPPSVPVVMSITLEGQSVLVGGSFNDQIGPGAAMLRRLNPDGSEATRFDERAFLWDTEVRSIVIQPDLKIIVAGALNNDALTGQPVTNALVKRFLSDGQVDPSFSAALLEWTDLPKASALKLQSDGGLIVGGDFYSVDSLPYAGVCRLRNSAPTLLLNPKVQAGYFQFNILTLPGASYTLEALTGLGGSWQAATSFVGSGTMEAHQATLQGISGFFRIRQNINN